ncbi:MAG: PorT family protein [Bacteroidia bacterium]|nr:PorT family protein [Bacteroidia bacterium]
MKNLWVAFFSLLWAQRFETGILLGPQSLTWIMDLDPERRDFQFRLQGIELIAGASEIMWFWERWGLSVDALYAFGRLNADEGAWELSRTLIRLKVPLMLRYTLPMGERSRLELAAGPQVAFVLTAEEWARSYNPTLGRDTSYTENLLETTSSSRHRRFQGSVVCMGGWRTKRVGLFLRYEALPHAANRPKLSTDPREWYNSVGLLLSYFIQH